MKKPTSPGYWWANDKNFGWIIIEVQENEGELMKVSGYLYDFFDDYTEFRGPILLEHYLGG